MSNKKPGTRVTFSAAPTPELHAALVERNFSTCMVAEYTFSGTVEETTAILDDLGVKHEVYLAQGIR